MVILFLDCLVDVPSTVSTFRELCILGDSGQIVGVGDFSSRHFSARLDFPSLLLTAHGCPRMETLKVTPLPTAGWRWCYTIRFAMPIFSAAQRCNVGTKNVVHYSKQCSRHDVAALFSANNRSLPHRGSSRVPAPRSLGRNAWRTPKNVCVGGYNNRCCDSACNINLKLGQKAQGDEDRRMEREKRERTAGKQLVTN